MSRRFLLHHAAALALLAASPLTMAAAPALSPTDLTCQFQATPRADRRVTLTFTLRNAGKQDLHLLRWGSPFEGGWFGPFVQATGRQGELPFQGAMRKRGDPSAQDYLLLKAGQSLSTELLLNDAFAWPSTGTGTLTLKAAWRWHDVITPGAKPPRPRALHQGLDQTCGDVTLHG